MILLPLAAWHRLTMCMPPANGLARMARLFMTFYGLTDIEQVKNEKKSFIFRCMLRQMTLENAGEGQPWHQSM